jgi:hypothetical protein
MTHSHPTKATDTWVHQYRGEEGVKPTGYMGGPKQTIGDLHINRKGEKICLKESLQRGFITSLELAENGIV